MLNTIAKVVDGELIYPEKDKIKQYSERFEGEFLSVEFNKPKNFNTIKQMRWYRGAILPAFAQYSGYSKEAAHWELKKMFLSKKYYKTDKDGTKILAGEMVDSIADLNTKEFTEFIEKVREFCSDFFGRYIPTPDEYWQGLELEKIK